MTNIDPLNRHWSGADSTAAVLKDAAGRVAQLRSTAAEHDRLGTFAADELAALRADGYLALLVPEELGGRGRSYAELCAVLATLAHGCPATALTLSMHSHLVAAQVWRHKRAMPAPVLGRVAAEKLLLVSTGASDWLSSEGSAVPVDGGFRVTARKLPASGCPAGDVLVTSVRWDDAPDGAQVLHLAIPFSTAGVRVERTWYAMGMRATGSDTVVLDDVFVPDAAVALQRPADRWHPIWSTVLGSAMPLIMAVYVGVAEEAVDVALRRARARSASTADAAVAGRMVNQLGIARDAVATMVALNDDCCFDNTDALAAAVLSRKTVAADACIATVRLALELAGGSAYGGQGPLERLHRDVHGALFHPLPAARQELLTGCVALGLGID